MNDIRIGYTLWPRHFELVEPGPMLDEAERMGVDSVEIPFFTTRLIADGRICQPALKWFEGHTSGRPFGYTTHAMLTINLMDDASMIPIHEQVLKANIELTARLGASIMVLHCGLCDSAEHGELEAAYARQRESLARMADFAKSHGVVICLETIWNFDGRETALPTRLAEEIRAVGHPALMATIDYAHCLLQCSVKSADFCAEIAAIAPLSRHIHLNDCFGEEKPYPIALPAETMAYGSGDLHLPIGWGAIPWDKVLTELDYPEGDLVLNQELHPRFWYALADDVAELRRLRGLMSRRNQPA